MVARVTLLRWENPPPATRIRIDWREVSRQLRARPGEWAVVYQGRVEQTAAAHLSQLKTGRKLPMRPADEFEYARHGCKVYARYVGSEGCPEMDIQADVFAVRRRALKEALG